MLRWERIVVSVAILLIWPAIAAAEPVGECIAKLIAAGSGKGTLSICQNGNCTPLAGDGARLAAVSVEAYWEVAKDADESYLIDMSEVTLASDGTCTVPSAISRRENVYRSRKDRTFVLSTYFECGYAGVLPGYDSFENTVGNGDKDLYKIHEGHCGRFAKTVLLPMGLASSEVEEFWDGNMGEPTDDEIASASPAPDYLNDGKHPDWDYYGSIFTTIAFDLVVAGP
jgi:hypothetical protein